MLQAGESVTALVHRAALAGMTKIDPYITALHLLQAHVADGDFGPAEDLANEVMAHLPPTPISLDRSALENLHGAIAVFRAQLEPASDWFHRALESDPGNAAAALNAAFSDIQLGRYALAANHIDSLLSHRPPTNRTLLATAYATWSAALVVQQDIAGAEQRLSRAVQADPSNSAAYDLWSHLKRVAHPWSAVAAIAVQQPGNAIRFN